MAGRKTRIEKLQAEIKNLKRENDELRVSKEVLRIEVAEMHKREEIRGDEEERSLLVYL